MIGGRGGDHHANPGLYFLVGRPTATRRANHFVRRATACPALFAKIFWFSERPNQVYIPTIPSHTEGRCATSRTRSGMRWTRMVHLTRAPDADGEVVWS
jgi:hypothetical protein